MKYVDIHSFDDIGYHKLFAYNTWRVAMLNYIDELEVENIAYVEAHAETDEAFVLLEGHCVLYFAEVIHGKIKTMCYEVLKPNKVYRIPKGIYHTHTLSHDAKLLIIEEENTSYQNSPRVYIDDDARQLLRQAYKEACHV
jgi:cupin superfamily acireductone dioxygenase involved in methionine salvage